MRAIALLAATIAAALCASGAALPAPQSFNTALPVAKDQWLLRLQTLHVRGEMARVNGETRAVGGIGVLGYGVDPDLTLFAALPLFSKRLDLPQAGGETRRREATGIGDLRLFARYTVFKRNFPGATFRIAPFAGAELPTGRSAARDAVGQLPPRLQPGSGAVDPFFGVVATYQTLAFELDAQLAYRANRSDGGFGFGNVLRADLAGQVRIWPREIGTGRPGFLFAGLEVNYADTGRDHRRGERVAGTGGQRLFLSPGLQYVTRRWVIESQVQLPVHRDLGPGAIREDLRVRAGVRLNF